MQCRICSSTALESTIDLGLQPWANDFLRPEQVGKEPHYPLHVFYCTHCCTAQLNHTVAKEVMFSDHTYLSGVTRSLDAHFATVAKQVHERFLMKKKVSNVLDIGSNDGTQLLHYKKLGCDVLGVEPSKRTAIRARENGVPTDEAFFNDTYATSLNRRFDVINASGVFFHLEELHSATKAVAHLLEKEGVFVVQFLYMKSIMENGAFDQIYHEHLLYYTLKTVDHLLNLYDLELFDAYLSPIHGGSIIAFVSHRGAQSQTMRLSTLKQEEEASQCNSKEAYLRLARRVQEMKSVNLSFLTKKKKEGKRIFGMGAPVKGNTLLNTFGIGKQYLDCLVEKNTFRKGLYSPGQHLPIVLEDEIDPPDVYYVLAWNFKNEILANNTPLIDKGVEFYFPVEVGA